MYIDEGFDDFEISIEAVTQSPIHKGIHRYLPKANDIRSCRPVVQATRAIKGFIDYKLPSYLQLTSTIDRPSQFEQKQTKQSEKGCYKCYEIEETLQQRYRFDNYSIREVYSRYQSKREPYKFFCYAGKYISMGELVNLQTEDCHQLGEMDLDNKTNVSMMCGKSGMFSSNFESGNLYKAFQVGPDEYDLVLENDTNTKGYNQWFFFMVTSFSRNSTIKLNIVNMSNKGSLFQKGMKPCIMSLEHFRNTNHTWFRGGFNVEYTRNNLKRRQDFHYTLSFSYKFQYSNDTVFFALNFPYSYSKLLRSISAWEDEMPSLKKESLCSTISKNTCPLLTLGNKDKPIIIVLARQHPGESVGSYVLQGIIQGIKKLPVILDKFHFKIIPMLNVDGCIYGNFRTGLSGSDLNRKWNRPDKYFTPEVLALSNLMQKFKKGQVKYFIDLHGHSTNLGTFIYSSTKGRADKQLAYEMGQANLTFDRNECTFGIHASKIDTARALIHYKLEGCKSLTIQTSLFGFLREGKVDDYYPNDLLRLGEDVVVCLLRTQSSDKRLPNSFVFNSKRDEDSTGSEKDPTEDQIEEIQKDIKRIQKKYGVDNRKVRKRISSSGNTLQRNKIKSMLRLPSRQHQQPPPILSRPKTSLKLTVSQQNPICTGKLFYRTAGSPVKIGNRQSPLLRITKKKRTDPKNSLIKLQRYISLKIDN